MHETGKKMLDLMFKPGETVCVSHNKYGYHSIPLVNALWGPVVMVPTEDSLAKRGIALEDGIERISSDEVLLCALNPIKGFREDANCTAFRNFLVEMDYGSIQDQLAYIKKLGLPYSGAVFSGNKSIHFLISLDRDLPSEKSYRTFSEWILKIITLADPMTKNPSRSIRVPGAMRDTGKTQDLLEFNGPVPIETLANWLRRFPGEKPKEREKRVISDKPKFHLIKPWVCQALVDGVFSPNRNRKWFAIACEFALTGHEEDYTIGVLGEYFSPERDFTEREWETTVRSAFKFAHDKRRNG
jgi:hypothetical protein